MTMANDAVDARMADHVPNHRFRLLWVVCAIPSWGSTDELLASRLSGRCGHREFSSHS